MTLAFVCAEQYATVGFDYIFFFFKCASDISLSPSQVSTVMDNNEIIPL